MIGVLQGEMNAGQGIGDGKGYNGDMRAGKGRGCMTALGLGWAGLRPAEWRGGWGEDFVILAGRCENDEFDGV